MARAHIPLKVWWQYLMGIIFYAPFMWWVIAGVKLRGWRIKDLRNWRKFYKDLTDEKYPPLVICANHLSYVDSILIMHAFGNHFWYPFNFRRHPWNLVAKEYSKNPVFHFVCYFSKCLYLDRESEKKSSYPTLTSAINLLRLGEVVLVFPEGRRTKTGRFDDSKLAYGVGKMISEVGECRVLCTYVRTDKQGERSSGFPPFNSEFKILTELVRYNPKDHGDNAVATITEDIALRIKKLEKQYFETLGRS